MCGLQNPNVKAEPQTDETRISESGGRWGWRPVWWACKTQWVFVFAHGDDYWASWGPPAHMCGPPASGLLDGHSQTLVLAPWMRVCFGRPQVMERSSSTLFNPPPFFVCVFLGLKCLSVGSWALFMGLTFGLSNFLDFFLVRSHLFLCFTSREILLSSPSLLMHFYLF